MDEQLTPAVRQKGKEPNVCKHLQKLKNYTKETIRR